jgi:putative glutamine amidotransferase
MVGEKYIDAIRDGSGALPLLIPVLDPLIPPDDLLAAVDGLLFTGSPSNVAPRRYDGTPAREGTLLDEARDDTTLALLTAAIARGVPLLCLCRGFQELNVALGGTLHQHLQELPGRIDHRENPDDPLDAQYAPAHDVVVQPDGLLSKIVASRRFAVNSLHAQGIDRLAERLHADATAPDGTIEAVSLKGANAFVLGLQWHPEWRWAEDEQSRTIFSAFGQALRAGSR